MVSLAHNLLLARNVHRATVSAVPAAATGTSDRDPEPGRGAGAALCRGSGDAPLCISASHRSRYNYSNSSLKIQSGRRRRSPAMHSEPGIAGRRDRNSEIAPADALASRDSVPRGPSQLPVTAPAVAAAAVLIRGRC